MTQQSKDNLTAIATLLLAVATLAVVHARGTSDAPDLLVAGEPCVAAVSAPLPAADWSRSLIERATRQRERVRLDGASTAHLERLGWTYAQIARLGDDRAYFELAAATAACLEQNEAGSHAALLLRGHVDHNLHRFARAERSARRLVAERGAWFDYALLGDALIEQGRVDEAAEAWQAMMDLRPGPHAYTRAAHLRWLKGDTDGAIDMALRAARTSSARDPLERARAHADLAGYLLAANRRDEAQRSLDIALAIAPAEPRARALQKRINGRAAVPHHHFPHS